MRLGTTVRKLIMDDDRNLWGLKGLCYGDPTSLAGCADMAEDEEKTRSQEEDG